MLTQLELDLIGLLQEECAEVIQIASKVRRFGWQSRNPYIVDSPTNQTMLEHELGDVRTILRELVRLKCVDDNNIEARVPWKRQKLVESGVLPKPPTLDELFADQSPEEMAAWESFDLDRQQERKRDGILHEICTEEVFHAMDFAEENLTEWDGKDRKYLLQKAAEILKVLERITPDEH